MSTAEPKPAPAAAESKATTEKAEKPKPFIVKRIWTRLGLNKTLAFLIVKGACGPVVALSLFQWTAFADYFSSVGYLVAIVTILSLPFQPRAKFFQATMFNLIAICIGFCINLLMCFCVVKARQHTAPPMRALSDGPTSGTVIVPYNSSASAVAGVWLFFNVLFANAVRFKLPQLQITVILYSIAANVSAVYAPQFPNMPVVFAFIKRLLTAFLSGFGIATVIHLLVFPTSTRNGVQAQMAGYLASLKGVMKSEKAYLQSMMTADCATEEPPGDKGNKEEEEKESPITVATERLKTAVTGLSSLHGQLAQDLVFAKRELAWGKLNAKDLDTIFKLLRQILLPSLGIVSVVDVFKRLASGQSWDENPDRAVPEPQSDESKQRDRQNWAQIMQALNEPFEGLAEAVEEGLTHVGYCLELTPRPKKKGQGAPTTTSSAKTDSSSDDIEAKAGARAEPGSKEFRDRFLKQIQTYSRKNKESLQEWCRLRNLTDEVLNPEIGSPPGKSPKAPLPEAERERRDMYMILYLEFLLWSTAKAVLNLVDFADEKVASGQMKRNKLIYPGKKRLKKWFMGLLSPDYAAAEHAPGAEQTAQSNWDLPNALRRKKDPEHLEPTNAWQRFGELVSKIGDFLSSTEVTFGFRVACATLSVGIMAFLEPTQHFFTQQRLFWAQIMIAISMSMTSGSGIFQFVLKIIGTALASCVSLVLWYIAGGRGIPGALLPILWVVYMPEVYWLIKKPRFKPVFMVTMITQVLILGYELEANKIGQAALQVGGQAYHPIYVLAWIRLATVVGGLAVAFIWTYFPYPVTAKNAVRMRLGDSIYLLASYYSAVHATIGLRIQGTGGDPDDKGSPAHQIRKTRFKIVPKMLGLLGEIRGHLSYTRFELAVGGRFPKKLYADITTEVNNVFNYMSLIDYATATYATSRLPGGEYRRNKDSKHVGVSTRPPSPVGDSSEGRNEDGDNDDGCGPEALNEAWLNDLARVQRTIDVTTEDITSLLSLMSFCIRSAQPLPPFLRAPTPFLLSNRIRQIDPDVLSVRHVTEPGYAAFAVTQIASRLISADIEKLLANVKELVGEVDFTFHPRDAEAVRLGEEAHRVKTAEQRTGKVKTS